MNAFPNLWPIAVRGLGGFQAFRKEVVQWIIAVRTNEVVPPDMQPAGCPCGSHPLVRITVDSDYESRGSVSNAKPGPRSFDGDRILQAVR